MLVAALVVQIASLLRDSDLEGVVLGDDGSWAVQFKAVRLAVVEVGSRGRRRGRNSRPTAVVEFVREDRLWF